MEPIKDEELDLKNKELKNDKIVVYGEGCLYDCPHRHSWTSSTIGCGTTYDAFISKKR